MATPLFRLCGTQEGPSDDDDDDGDDDDDYQLKLMALDEAGYGSRTVKALYGFLSRPEIGSNTS